MKGLAALALVALGAVGYPLEADADSVDITVSIDAQCACTVTERVKVEEKKDDVVVWGFSFSKGCKTAQTMFVCPTRDYPFLDCKATGSAKIREPFTLSANRPTNAAMCTVNWGPVYANPNCTSPHCPTFPFQVVYGPATGSVLKCPETDAAKLCKTQRLSEIAIETVP